MSLEYSKKKTDARGALRSIVHLLILKFKFFLEIMPLKKMKVRGKAKAMVKLLTINHKES